MTLDLVIICILILLSLVLIAAEMFLIPGITIAGIAGGFFVIGGVYYAYKVSLLVGNITLICTVVLYALTFFWLIRRNSLSRVALNTESKSKVPSASDSGVQMGDEGISLSRLAPIGKARFGSKTVEVKSLTEMIDEQTPIIALKIDGYNIIVKKKDN